MHICLPDTRELRPQHGSAYLLYNVHIDGLYHCSLRYKQLLHLHQTLSKKYHQLPSFPPKKLLPLSLNQVEERRVQLEKYLQNISQDKAISNSSIFNLFLLEAQRESTRIRESQAHLDIELVNGQKIRLQVFTHDSADAVLTAVCRALGLNDRYHAYFCLCLCGYDVVRDKLIIKRRLSFFESPYVTLQVAIQQQEQLQNVLANNRNYYPQPESRSQQSTNITSISNCQCLNCSNYQQQTNSLTTNSVPSNFCSSPSGSMNNNNNNHLGHYNQDNNNFNDICSNYNQYHSNETCYYSNHHHQQSLSHQIPSNQNESNLQHIIQTTTETTSFVTHRILLRKSYWDPIYDTYILNDQNALNLLFIQTVYDIKHSLMFVDRETYHQLESLLNNDSKLEYILLARTLKYYNYVHFEPCLSDYPRPRTKVMISIGSKELNMRVLKSPKSLAIKNTTVRNGQPQHPLGGANVASSSSPGPASTTARTLDTTNKSIDSRDQTSIQQVKEPSEQVLYCTSSLGYNHRITKDDLVEEEYNFKVPLIRCWRLTSLETLVSNRTATTTNTPDNSSISSLASSQVGNVKRKTLSLFNSLNINHNSNIIRQHESNNKRNNNNGNGNLFNSGSGGVSLLAALAGSGATNGFHRSRCRSENNGSNHYIGQTENHHISNSMSALNQSNQPFSQYELSFEYLVSKDCLRWITISSDQAIFISISLQGVVDELVSKRNGSISLYGGGIDSASVTMAQPNQQSSSPGFSYMYRDGTQKTLDTNNQQLIDKFGTTLGYSPMNPYVLALARQRQLSLRASNGHIQNTSRIALLGNSTSDNRGNPHYSSFEISNFKKAPSPIINDAFEGVTNDDDL